MDSDLSVIVTTHNVRHWIDECLVSILASVEPLREVIVVDDASSDGTWDVVERFAAADSRVRAVRSPYRGGAQARNHGVSLAQGDLIAFADGDDIVPPGAYAAMSGAIRRTGSDVAVGDFLKFSTVRTWTITRGWHVFETPLEGEPLSARPGLIRNRACWNRIFRRAFWVGQGLLYPSVPRSNDIVPMTRALLGASRIAVVPDVVYLYRSRPGGSSMTSRAAREESLLSYLSQELVCARTVAGAAEGVLREYWSMVLRSDAWNHLSAFLRSGAN